MKQIFGLFAVAFLVLTFARFIHGPFDQAAADPQPAEGRDTTAAKPRTQGAKVTLSPNRSALVEVLEPSRWAIEITSAPCYTSACARALLQDVSDASLRWQYEAIEDSSSSWFRDEITLDPGHYRLQLEVSETVQNDSAATLSIVDLDNPAPISTRDMPLDSTLVLGMTGLGGNVDSMRTFTINRPVSLLLRALGELTARDTRDAAMLISIDADSTIWQQTRQQGWPAGGIESNWRSEALVYLQPGRYALRFSTDASHDAEDSRGLSADLTRDWGVSMYTVFPSDRDAITVHQEP